MTEYILVDDDGIEHKIKKLYKDSTNDDNYYFELKEEDHADKHTAYSQWERTEGKHVFGFEKELNKSEIYEVHKEDLTEYPLDDTHDFYIKEAED